MRYFVLLLTFALMGGISDRSFAQSSGMFGARTLGGGVNGPQPGFQGSPGDRVEQMQSGAGEVTGNERFVRDSRQPGAFVGSDSGDTANFFSQLGNQITTSGLQGLNRNANRANLNNANNRPPLATKLSLGFTPVGRSEEVINQRLTTLLTKIPQLENVQALSVIVEGSTVVLRGQVASDHDRQMMARIARLEPGVYAVRNELTVGTGRGDVDSPEAGTLPEPLPPSQPESTRESLPTNPPVDSSAPAPVAPQAPQVNSPLPR